MPDIVIKGARFHYEDDDFANPWEQHEVVFFHHGFARNGKVFHGWAPELAMRFRVIRFDARGHGDSDDPGEGYSWSLQSFASDIRDFLDAMKLKQVHYVGESLGGVIGIVFATTYPERVKTLTLCTTPTVMREASAKLRALDYPDWGAALKALGVQEWYMRYRAKTGDLNPNEPGKDAWYAGQFAKVRMHSLQTITKMTSTVNVDPLLPKLQCPTLILAPATSKTSTALEQQLMLRRVIPRSEIYVFEGQGHLISINQQDECARLTAQFIRKHVKQQ